MFEDATPGSWFALYKQALLEVDPIALPGRIQLARAAIRARLGGLAAGTLISSDEQQSLQDGLRTLMLLEREQQEGLPPQKLPDTPYVVLAGRDRRWIAISDAACELLGYPREELLGKQIDELAAPDLSPATPEVFEEFVKSRSMDGDFALLHKQGHVVAFHYKARVFPDGSMIAFWYPKPDAS